MSKLTIKPLHEGTLTNVHGTVPKYTDTGYDALHVSTGGSHGHFDVEHASFDGGYISGTTRFGADDFDTSFAEWPSFWRDTGSMPWPPVALDTPSKAWLSTQLIADTNPSKPKADIGRAIGELKDLPGMLFDIGKGLIKKSLAATGGNTWLTYKFGWAPFAADVASLFECQALVKARFDQLNHLKEHGSVIRKKNLWDQTNSTRGVGFNDYWKMSLETRARDHVWGYTIWRTTDSFPDTPEDLFQLARKCALGLTLRPKMAWDLLPWSWAIDWFANVGTFLQAMDNTAGLELAVANLCMTQERLRRADHPVLENNQNEHFNLGISDIEYYNVRKYRFRADPPTLAAQFPILDNGQLGILASIASK